MSSGKRLDEDSALALSRILSSDALSRREARGYPERACAKRSIPKMVPSFALNS